MTDTKLADRAVDAALRLASEKSWDDVSLAEIAREAQLDLADFYGELDIDAVLSAIDRRFDLACSSEPVSTDDKLKDRIFEVTMLRFEAMEDHRAALMSIRKSWKYNPVERLKAAKRRTRTARWILTCAEADFAGAGPRAVLLSGILSRAEAAWEKEDSPDFTRTMAHLDRDLRDVNDFAGRIKKFTSSFKAKKKETTEAESPAS